MSDCGLEFTFTGTTPQHFTQPAAVFVADTPSQAWSILHNVERLRAQGFAIAGYISYELGYSCVDIPTPKRNETQQALPYLVLGAFHCNAPTSTQQQKTAPFSITPLRPRMSREDYRSALSSIAKDLYNGDVYQVNFTVPFDFDFIGDPDSAFTTLQATTQAPYAACMRFAHHALISLSPELFLRFQGSQITTKPMKGTASLDTIEHLHSAKNRAEHIMIVDLLRNDLSIVCDRVWVEQLFQEERYPTFATMTSTIVGSYRIAPPFAEILRALFPCGSITGAPKRSAIATIARLESHVREAYCGTIGYLLPNGEGEWNVAIRTMQLDCNTGRGRLDLGGGIVADSQADDEWQELEIKGRFISHVTQQ